MLFGIVFVLYCCFVQCIWLESGLMRILFTFPNLIFSLQFNDRFFIFFSIIFNFFHNFCSVSNRNFFLLSNRNFFYVKIMPFGTHNVGFVYILSKYNTKINPFQTKSCLKKSRCFKNCSH